MSRLEGAGVYGDSRLGKSGGEGARVSEKKEGQIQGTEVTLEELQELLQQSCMLSVPKEKIREETPLFGPGGLGLDSIDALQLIVAIQQKYGVSVEDPEEARQALATLAQLRHWLSRKLELSP
ncbi:acyl carrier protein [Candidatus Methylacidithermus pantelleriae]|uniref:Carrier domain-containing protein n=1 Tax=Candidatus Methylacidithermus pantelleriae TaxID=2744239 RepID=A0A8J2BQ33_9BACT|nr:phosphopantetheine-binding protein [Candidatus Methylacidithermus pantelleriae]CAF0698348.1 hypothetical protein MPNT_260017 [Candidatus Methylacidithermus pantelleriae]